MDLLPALGNLREYFVVALAQDGLILEAIVLQPALADGDIPHLGVHQGDGRRGVLHEELQLLRPLLAMRFGQSAVRDVGVDHHQEGPLVLAEKAGDPVREPAYWTGE